MLIVGNKPSISPCTHVLLYELEKLIIIAQDMEKVHAQHNMSWMLSIEVFARLLKAQPK